MKAISQRLGAILALAVLLVAGAAVAQQATVKELVGEGEGEEQAAKEKAEAVKHWLADRSFPAPVMSQSGNGYHLLYAIDLEVTDEHEQLIKDFIETVAGGTPVLHEHSEIGWFTAEELVRLPLAPADAFFASSLVDQTS